MVPGLLATVIFVLPAPIRLTCLGVSSTPLALTEAATERLRRVINKGNSEEDLLRSI